MKLVEIVAIAFLVLLPSLGWGMEEHPPDADMLEFLGRFETAGGKAVDPRLFEETVKRDKKNGQPSTSKDTRKRKAYSDAKETKGSDNEK